MNKIKEDILEEFGSKRIKKTIMTNNKYNNKTELSVPSNYPTTSDISMFMRELGFEWSNQAQLYFHSNSLKYEYLSRATAERLYKYLIGDKPYSPLIIKNEDGQIQ